MKILLLGKDGQLGWELQRALAPLGELVACGRRGDGALDLHDLPALQQRVRELQPQLIVNAAAYTAVDRAETEAESAHRVNAEAPALLAQEAQRLGAWLVHYSTDYVFDGSGNAPRDETATTGPLSVYGRSKLAGEDGIRASGARHVILRTSWVHAARGGNFARTMLRLAAERDTLNVVSDQVGAPTGAELLADVTALALRSLRNQPGLGGTYHLAAGGETSWFDYARFVIDWGRRHGQPVRLAPDALKPIATAQYPTPAQRPLNSRLDTRRLQSAFGLTLPHWTVGVERMLHEACGA